MSTSPNKPELGSGLIRLEERTVPTVVGNPWPDATGLTVSFARDGSKVDGVGSVLTKTLDGVASRSVWQREVLRAFQTWVTAGNVNFGLVADGGDPFGTVGDLQGDARFGDVRIGAVPLSSGVGATANYFDWTAGTWSGDVLLNSGVKFAANPSAGASALDLYTVALHEVGHALGFQHSDDLASVMFEGYAGVRGGLAAGDAADLQATYGTRMPDVYEGPTGNDTQSAATPLGGGNNMAVAADLTTAGDVDWFSFQVPTGKDKAKLRLYTSGVSLLVGQFQLTDSAGKVIGTASAGYPTAGDLRLDVDHLVSGQRYYLRVAAADPTFGVGRYQLQVNFDAEPGEKEKFAKDAGTNDTRATATSLDLPDDRGWGNPDGRMVSRGVIESATDVDWYRLAAPADAAAGAMQVTVRAMKSDKVAPALTVVDAAGNALPTTVLRTAGNRYTVQALGVVPGGAYFFRLASPTDGGAVGNYRLKVSFDAPQGYYLEQLAAGQLGPQLTSASGTLSVSASSLFQFRLASDQLATAPDARLVLTVTGADGKVVYTLTASAGSPMASGAVYLAAGSYSVKVQLLADKGSTLPTLAFDLDGGLGSDPIGTYKPPTGGTTVPPPPPPPPPSYTYTGSSTTRPTGSTYTF